MNRDSQNPRVPASQPGRDESDDLNIPGVRVHLFFAFGPLLISFRLQLMATLKEGDQCQMWEFRPLPS